MPPILTPSKRVEETHYDRHFHWRSDEGAGFSFPCDKEGKIQLETLQPQAITNLDNCLRGVYDVVDDGIREWVTRYTIPATIQCLCGKILSLDDPFLSTCECGRDYNGCGQLLAPRSQWGEETGETLSDILNPIQED